MNPKKRYALTVAKQAWESEHTIIVAHIPWDQFEAPGGPDAYASLLERSGAVAVIVSKSPDGKLSSSTKMEKEWKRLCEGTPLNSLEWHTMAVEADHYPWELFGSRS